MCHSIWLWVSVGLDSGLFVRFMSGLDGSCVSGGSD